MSASVNLPLHHKVQKFSSGTGSPRWSRKKGRQTVVVWCGGDGWKVTLAQWLVKPASSSVVTILTVSLLVCYVGLRE